MISIQYEKRDKGTKPATIRRSGKIPAVFYGKKIKSTPISVSSKEFERAFSEAGENAVVTLQGSAGEIPALIHEVEKHPVSNEIEHIDFYAFEAGQKVSVRVPLEFTGTSPAVKEKGAVLVKVLRELSIEAEPKNLPRSISVDIAPLVDFTSQILAKDISLPNGVSLIEKSEEVIASVYEPKEEKIEEVVVAPDLSTIEVVKKGKEETAEDATEAAATPKTTEAKKEEKK
jgi:large subunit ribosomal protein L25